VHIAGKGKADRLERRLFVADAALDQVDIFTNKKYRRVGQITELNGIDGADGIWISKQGNLYVANNNAVNVVEYTPGATSPTCTYSTGLIDPINVTTDDHENVYVVDYNPVYYNNGFIDEYSHCSNTITTHYLVSGHPEGAAVNRRGEVFVLYNLDVFGRLEKFHQGSPNPIGLRAVLGRGGGLILDKNQNLIAADQDRGDIDIIPPPYKSKTIVIKALVYPFHIGLNKQETRLFVTAPGQSASLLIYSYPGLALLKSLSEYIAVGVSDSPNAVF
jgi:hypothetical protein